MGPGGTDTPHQQELTEFCSSNVITKLFRHIICLLYLLESLFKKIDIDVGEIAQGLRDSIPNIYMAAQNYL